jgi:signal transduction histidine kinase
MDSIWREAWHALETGRRNRQVKLIEKPCDGNLEVFVDRFRMGQVFRNLLENALAACHDPVVIEIECKVAQLAGQPAIALRVRDNGPGLAPAVRTNVFEPFFTTKTKGTGLGMAIARRIIEAHGGEITVDQEYTAGAGFVITLPMSNV